MFGGKALGKMAGALIWMPGAPGRRTLIVWRTATVRCHKGSRGWHQESTLGRQFPCVYFVSLMVGLLLLVGHLELYKTLRKLAGCGAFNSWPQHKYFIVNTCSKMKRLFIRDGRAMNRTEFGFEGPRDRNYRSFEVAEEVRSGGGGGGVSLALNGRAARTQKEQEMREWGSTQTRAYKWGLARHPRTRAQGCIGREGTSEVEAFRQAVGGGCQSGWGRLLSVTNAIEAGTCRQGDSSWA